MEIQLLLSFHLKKCKKHALIQNEALNPFESKMAGQQIKSSEMTAY